ncbi:hypothetical protein [Thalassotalea sediminis]|uniref:hypothetical protein n=1 Tax=Thalassotalea sediminis TaxID=1759089 RepID=UPI002572E1CA|nr:hypothetical protein [Thalassotalea sediminis]
MEFILIAAITLLCWMAWQLWRAKQFTKFKQYLFSEIRPLVLTDLEQRLIEQRCATYPNSDFHIMAAKEYWTAYASRILQYALTRELVSEEKLKQQGKYRFCQHLFHIEADKMHQYCVPNDQQH